MYVFGKVAAFHEPSPPMSEILDRNVNLLFTVGMETFRQADSNSHFPSEIAGRSHATESKTDALCAATSRKLPQNDPLASRRTAVHPLKMVNSLLEK